MDKEKHKWWHLFYGNTFECSKIAIGKFTGIDTISCWTECKKCGNKKNKRTSIIRFREENLTD